MNLVNLIIGYNYHVDLLITKARVRPPYKSKTGTDKRQTILSPFPSPNISALNKCSRFPSCSLNSFNEVDPKD